MSLLKMCECFRGWCMCVLCACVFKMTIFISHSIRSFRYVRCRKVENPFEIIDRSNDTNYWLKHFQNRNWPWGIALFGVGIVSIYCKYVRSRNIFARRYIYLMCGWQTSLAPYISELGVFTTFYVIVRKRERKEVCSTGRSRMETRT